VVKAVNYFLAVVGFCLWPFSVSAELVCLTGWESVKTLAQEQGESVVFLGVNNVDHALYLFAGQKTFTLFFSPDGKVFCTNDAMLGLTVSLPKEELENAVK